MKSTVALIDWFGGDEEERRALVKTYSADRDELLEQCHYLAPDYASCMPSEKVELVLTEVCGFHVVDEPLPRGQLALCDFANRTVLVNSELERFVHHKTDLTLLRRSTLAHELGHIRLHYEEMKDGCTIHYFGDTGQFADARFYQKEREADLYAGIFLVPLEQLLGERSVQRMLHNLKNRQQMGSGTLWKIIYRLASQFQVSPALIKRSFLEFGWMETVQDKHKRSKALQLRLGQTRRLRPGAVSP